MVLPAAHDLSIRQLQYLVAVAETLGFHKAAEKCGVSQPTLSSQVQKLEEVLGVQVFERNKQRVLLTRAGEAVIAHARRILVDVDDLIATAGAARDAFSGTLRLAVIPTIAPYLLPFVAPAIAATWPRLRLALIEEKTGEMLVSLRNGAIDAGLLAVVDEMEDLERIDIFEDPFVAAVPQGHALAKKKAISLQDLEDEPVLLLEDGHCLRTQALALCQRAGASETDLRATSLATLVQMVSAGVGVTLLPSIAVPVENRRGQLAIRPLAGKAQGRTICLAWRKESALAEPLRELARVMATAAKGAR